MTINSKDYHDYVIKDGKLIGAFEEMYQKIDDPWNPGDATDIQYDLTLCLIDRYRIGGSILDIGCGLGAFTARLMRRLPLGSHILALDIAPTAIKKAEQKYGNLGIDFQVMDIREGYRSINGKFDLIVMAGLVWYILPEFCAIVKYLGKEKLKDIGYLLVTNHPVYKPRVQKYGNEVIANIEDLLGSVDLEVVEMIELNRLADCNTTILFKNKSWGC